MGKIIVYRFNYCITRKKRPRDRQSAFAWYSKLYTGAYGNDDSVNCYEVDGANISDTTGYVDIIVRHSNITEVMALSQLESFVIINDDTGFVKDGNDFSQNTITANSSNSLVAIPAFLNKVERTSFNSFYKEVNGVKISCDSYRIYFEIDWWTYNLLNYNFNIEFRGTIERANVNDFRNGTTKIVDEPRYTLPSIAEENVVNPVVDGETLATEVFYESGVKCCAVIYTTFDGKENIPLINCGGRIYLSNYNLGFIFIKENGGKGHFVANYEDPINPDVYFEFLKTPTLISDTQVLSIFELETNPFRVVPVTSDTYKIVLGTGYKYYPIATTSEQGVNSTLQAKYPWLPQNVGMKFTFMASVKEVPQQILSFSNLLITGTQSGSLESPNMVLSNISGSITYAEYCANYIRKLWWSAYDTWGIESCSQSIIIPLESIQIDVEGDYNGTSIMYINLNGGNSGYIIRIPSIFKNIQQEYLQFSSISEFFPVKLSDEYTQETIELQRQANETSLLNTQIKGIVSPIISGVASIAGFALGNPVAGLGGMLATAKGTIEAGTSISQAEIAYKQEELKIKQLEINGLYGTKLPSGREALNTRPMSLIHSYPSQVEMTQLKEHLAMYGYNTWVDLGDLFPTHNRKYFNYVKTNGVDIITPLSLQAKNHIIEMFNNGVWLFSAFAFTNPYNGSDSDGLGCFTLKCPNTPENI